MKFSEAMAALECGEKVRMKRWDDSIYIYCGPDDRLKWSTGVTAFITDSCIDEWELYDDKVEAGTLKEGNLFECSGCTYRLLPAYMLQYTNGRNYEGYYLPIINHKNGTLGFICVDAKVKKVNE